MFLKVEVVAYWRGMLDAVGECWLKLLQVVADWWGILEVVRGC